MIIFVYFHSRQKAAVHLSHWLEYGQSAFDIMYYAGIMYFLFFELRICIYCSIS